MSRSIFAATIKCAVDAMRRRRLGVGALPSLGLSAFTVLGATAKGLQPHPHRLAHFCLERQQDHQIAA
jgi:hypothetical protein